MELSSNELYYSAEEIIDNEELGADDMTLEDMADVTFTSKGKLHAQATPWSNGPVKSVFSAPYNSKISIIIVSCDIYTQCIMPG